MERVTGNCVTGSCMFGPHLNVCEVNIDCSKKRMDEAAEEERTVVSSCRFRDVNNNT